MQKNNIKELVSFKLGSLLYTRKNSNERRWGYKNSRYFQSKIFLPTGKILSEILSNNAKYFKKLLIFRPHNVYGPDMGFEHVIPELIYKIYKNKTKDEIKLKIKGSGKETRAFNYIDDFVDGFMIMLKKGKHLNLYNIGSKEEISIKDLVKKIANLLKIKIKIETSKLPKGGTIRRCPNINKLKKLGYKPKIRINEGLKPMLDWYKDNLNLKNNV